MARKRRGAARANGASRQGRLPARTRDALRRASDQLLGELIRRLLALPMNKRTHFLRVRQPGGGSAL